MTSQVPQKGMKMLHLRFLNSFLLKTDWKIQKRESSFLKNCSFQLKRLHRATWVKSSALVVTSPRSGGGGRSPAETRWLWAPVPGPLQLSRGPCINIQSHSKDFTSATMWSTPQATSTTCPGTVTWWMKEKMHADQNKWEVLLLTGSVCCLFRAERFSTDGCSAVTNRCALTLHGKYWSSLLPMPKQPRMFFPQTKSSPRSEKSTVTIELEAKPAEPQIRAKLQGLKVRTARIDHNPTSIPHRHYNQKMNTCITLLHQLRTCNKKRGF